QTPEASLGDFFDSGVSPQEASRLGWKGTNFYLTENGGPQALLQDQFFRKIFDGVGNNLEAMQGFKAAEAYNPFLRALVSGRMGVDEAASQAIAVLQALP